MKISLNIDVQLKILLQLPLSLTITINQVNVRHKVVRSSDNSELISIVWFAGALQICFDFDDMLKDLYCLFCTYYSTGSGHFKANDGNRNDKKSDIFFTSCLL